MRHAVPVEHFLLFLCSDAIVLVHEVQEWTLRLFERCIGPRFQIAQIGEYSLLEFLGILDWTAEGLEAKGETAHDVCARDMKEIVPVLRQQREPCSRYGGGTGTTYHSTHDTYSPVGSRKRLMY